MNKKHEKHEKHAPSPDDSSEIGMASPWDDQNPDPHDPNVSTPVRCDTCGLVALVSIESDTPAPDGWLWAPVHDSVAPYLVDNYLMVCSLACMRAVPWRTAVNGREEVPLHLIHRGGPVKARP